jgi:hypothetical protein
VNPQASYLLEAPNQIAGSFNANSLIEDEETGFLTQSLKCSEVQRVGSLGGISPLSKFNVKQKLLILLKLLQRWNITWACSQVGISRYTFQNHYTLDKSFAQCVDMIRYRSIDDVNEVRFTVAKTHAGAFDRMCLLNAYMPEVYNPKIQVEVQHKMSSSEATARSTGIQDAIDAEVVETVKRIKAAKNK